MKKLLILAILLCGISLHSQAQIYLDVANKEFSVNDSLFTTVDTLSRIDTLPANVLSNRLDKTFKWWYQFVIVPDSAIYVSTRSDFAAGSTFLIKAGESFTSPKYGLEIVNFYMKVVGVGKCLRRMKLFGN